MSVDLKPLEHMERGFVQPRRNDEPERPLAGEDGRARRPDRQYVPYVAVDVRVYRWLRSWILAPTDFDKDNRWTRLSRFKFWLVGRQSGAQGLYERLRSMAAALFGGFVAPLHYENRMKECLAACPFLKVALARYATRRNRYYCGSCGCPRWLLSQLRFKNRLRRWYCPQRRHVGPYPEDRTRALIAIDRERRGGE